MMGSKVKIYTLARVPGAGDDAVKWTDICHNKETIVFINHDPRRWVSRHTFAENKRPFKVNVRHGGVTGWYEYGSSSTYEGAKNLADRAAKFIEETPQGKSR